MKNSERAYVTTLLPMNANVTERRCRDQQAENTRHVYQTMAAGGEQSTGQPRMRCRYYDIRDAAIHDDITLLMLPYAAERRTSG